MSDKLDRRAQFYAYSTKYRKRMIFSFKVANKQDARRCLWRCGAEAGWFVEINKAGKIVTNETISPERPQGHF